MGMRQEPRVAKNAFDCRIHAQKRARERYDLYITVADIVKLEEKIRAGEAKKLLEESNSRRHYLIDDQWIVVYNRKLQAITTFLPPDAIFGYIPEKTVSSRGP
jgi:hypothetical protein